MWYRDWFNSPYYHLLYQDRDNEEADRFVDHLMEHLQAPVGAKVLDIACGKGRHSWSLYEKGYEVTGIDLSEASIEAARSMENDRLHFYVHDMRLPFRVNYYQYAFNFFTSFGYFRTRREHDNAMRTIAQSLVHNGVFVIDYLNVRNAEEHLEKTETLERDGVLFHITRWQDEDHFFKQVQITDATHANPHHLFTERVAKFSLGDLTDMFSYQGMQIQEVFGNYELGSYDVKRSPRLIAVARRI